MYFTVTVDTEEDDWGAYTKPVYGVENLRRVPRLQEMLHRRGVRPTYLITYPVATDPAAAAMLAAWAADGACEVGTHPHPWNTPPIEEDLTPHNSFISNLPPDLQFEKIRTLTETIERQIGVRPTSYRSGRWGFSDDIARHLIRLGYTVDSSIYPMTDWSVWGGPDYSRRSHIPYEYHMANGSGGRTLLEIPASVDFLQAPRGLATAVFHGLIRLPAGQLMSTVLAKAGLLNHVAISPEIHLTPVMIRMTESLLSRGTRVINMFFHSPTLLPGCSPFVRTEGEAEAFLQRIDGFVAFVQSVGLKPVTLSELTPGAVGVSDDTVLRA